MKSPLKHLSEEKKGKQSAKLKSLDFDQIEFEFEFDRQRFSLAIDADTPGDFFRRSRRCGSFENSCDKSPNLIGWLYWRFAAIKVENRGSGHTWPMPANLIPISDMPDIGDFIRRSRRSAKIAIAAPGTPGEAKCVAGFSRWIA